MSEDSLAPLPDLSAVRVRRAGLRRTAAALESALAEAETGPADDWPDRIRPAVVELAAAWAHHVAATESADGILRQIVEDAPRLVSMVQRLEREHRQVAELLRDADERLRRTGDVDRPRILPGLSTVAGTISRHRTAGGELIYRAYQVDLGDGE